MPSKLLQSRKFPMLDGPDVPWEWGKQFYALYHAACPNDQTIEIIAKRGGLGWDEIIDLNKRYKKKSGKDWEFHLREGQKTP